MKTIILPGFSEKNLEWVTSTINELSPKIEIEGIYWKHWNEEIKTNWKELEAQEVINKIADQKVNIIAKSIGTLILMLVLKLKANQINKIILCGIALKDFSDEDKKNFLILKDLKAENILSIQNINDNHGSYNDVKNFLYQINPNITTISKPSNNHDYPYSLDFINFLE